MLTKQKACLEKWTKGVHQVFGGRLSPIDEVGLVWLVRRCEAMGAPLVRRTWPQSRLSLMEVCGRAPHAPELSQVGPTVFQFSFHGIGRWRFIATLWASWRLWPQWRDDSVRRGPLRPQLRLHSLHTRGHIDQAPLDVSIDWHTKRKVGKASEDLPGGSVALPPCVPHNYVSHVRQEFASTPRAHHSDREVRSSGQEARHTCEREGGLRTVSELILRASRVHDARREQ